MSEVLTRSGKRFQTSGRGASGSPGEHRDNADAYDCLVSTRGTPIPVTELKKIKVEKIPLNF